MDSNVSKNTNSHIFFKLRINGKNSAISVENLLKKELSLILFLYQHKFNVQIEQSEIATILKNKVAIRDIYRDRQSENSVNEFGSCQHLMSVGYQCPLGLCLSKILQQSPTAIGQRFGRLLAERKDLDGNDKSAIVIEILDSGWLNFYLTPQFIAGWLNSCFNLAQQGYRQLEPSANSIVSDSAVFPVQYIHARCCSLLALAAREKLIALAPNPQRNIAPFVRPLTIDWLDKQDNLWFKQSAEYDLLRQLLAVADAWVKDSDLHWVKLAIGLSQATEFFLAECRFLGEVKAQHLQLAIARLGLIALVQFWLQRILREKLGSIAPKSI